MGLLSPQHWAQEAGDNHLLPSGMRKENNAHSCKLFWGQGLFSKAIPFDTATNTSIFYTLPAKLSYRAFVHTFQALEAPFFSREHALLQPGGRWLNRSPSPDPAEFVAEENINFRSVTTVSEGGNKRQDSPSLPRLDSSHPFTIQRDSLSFNPSPPLTRKMSTAFLLPTIKRS